MLLECSDPEDSFLFRPAHAVKRLKKQGRRQDVEMKLEIFLSHS